MFKHFALMLVLAIPAIVVLAGAADTGVGARQVVIVTQDDTPFKVGPNETVRLTGEGIAGSKIVADVDGPAMILAENSLVIMRGGHILIGMEKVEYQIKPTGKGTVKVKITTTPPQATAQPTVKTYEFEVQ
jgi:hypothetical protein